MNQVKNQMTDYEQSRWIALMDCVALISDTADKNKVSFENIQFNHPAMMHYVDEISDHVARVLKQESR